MLCMAYSSLVQSMMMAILDDKKEKNQAFLLICQQTFLLSVKLYFVIW